MDFGTVLIVVAVIAILIAAASYWGTGRIYSGLGREGGLDMTREPAVPSSGPEVQEEIRQMLEAKSDRRVARGEPELEIRQLVVARNERRLRQGKEPLDVESEIERQLRELGG